MGVTLRMDLTHPDLGKGHVRIEAEGFPNDLFIPMALKHLGTNDEKIADLFQQILNGMSIEDEDDDGSEDEER